MYFAILACSSTFTSNEGDSFDYLIGDKHMWRTGTEYPIWFIMDQGCQVDIDGIKLKNTVKLPYR